jgi:transcriptional regulator with XRE-family HTH domain
MTRNTPKAMALGAKLRSARESTGLSQRTLAKQLKIDQSIISRNESGDRSPTREEVATLLDALGVDGEQRDEIVEAARDTSGSLWLATDLPGQPVQLAALLDIEQMAREIVDWSPLIIPGLLQVGSYTRAIMRAEPVPKHEVETRVAIRLGRQEILSRRKPARLTAIIGESALRQRVGGADVLGEQLHHLLTMSVLHNIDLRVVTTDTGWHSGLHGPFTMITVDSTTSVVHLENARSAVFLPDSEDVEGYRQAVVELLGIALSAEQSTAFIAREAERIANAHDTPVEEVL